MDRLEEILRQPRSQGIMSILSGLIAIILSIDLKAKDYDSILLSIGVLAVLGGIIILMILRARIKP